MEGLQRAFNFSIEPFDLCFIFMIQLFTVILCLSRISINSQTWFLTMELIYSLIISNQSTNFGEINAFL